MTSIEVLKPGALSTFQDLGRHGFQQLGVPVAGVMDELSHRLANWAVGNPAGTSTLEITLTGPALRFNAACTIAWCGADLALALDGQPVPRATATRVAAGAVLQFGPRIAGLRSYLAFRGGLLLDEVMGSASTYLRGGFGGLQGRALRKGDGLTLRNPMYLRSPPQQDLTPQAHAALERLLAETEPQQEAAPLRLTRGREWEQFKPASQAELAGGSWAVSPQSDRMGYRLQGPPLQRRKAPDMLSEAVAFGTVQVPPDGQPIVLMADRQTTGGYPRIAQLASVDRGRLAQQMAGETLRFTMIELDQAQQLLLEREALWQVLTKGGE